MPDTIELNGQENAALDRAWEKLRAKWPKKAPEPDRFRSLAEWYAGLWNEQRRAGVPVSEDDLAAADAELDGSGWFVRHDPEADEWVTQQHAEQFAQARAPKGGVQVGSKWFAGGRWIPSKDLANATPEQKAQIEAAQQAHVEKRRGRGSVDMAALHEAVKPHAGELSPQEQRAARASYNALRSHHEDLTLHRMEELIGSTKKALAAIPEDHPNAEGLRDQFGKRLRAYGQMLGWAGEHGIDGRVETVPQAVVEKEEGKAEPAVEEKPKAEPAVAEKPSDTAARLKKAGYADTPRMRALLERADRVEASLPPVPEGQVRLWRGNRPGEEGKNPQFTNSLMGIALPFKDSYGGALTYVDVPQADAGGYVQGGAVADDAEFVLPAALAGRAKVVPEEVASGKRQAPPEEKQPAPAAPEQPEAAPQDAAALEQAWSDALYASTDPGLSEGERRAKKAEADALKERWQGAAKGEAAGRPSPVEALGQPAGAEAGKAEGTSGKPPPHIKGDQFKEELPPETKKLADTAPAIEAKITEHFGGADQAAKEGRTVPDAVRAEYPDLKPVAQAEKTATKPVRPQSWTPLPSFQDAQRAPDADVQALARAAWAVTKGEEDGYAYFHTIQDQLGWDKNRIGDALAKGMSQGLFSPRQRELAAPPEEGKWFETPDDGGLASFVLRPEGRELVGKGSQGERVLAEGRAETPKPVVPAEVRAEYPRVGGAKPVQGPGGAEEEKSQGHVGFQGDFEYFMGEDGDLYRAKRSEAVMPNGQRTGRWEAPAHLADRRIAMLGLKPESAAPEAKPEAAPGQPPQPESPRNRSAALRALPVGELATVDGFKVRRTGHGEWRIEKESGRGNVRGDEHTIHDYIARELKAQKAYGRALPAALARAESYAEPSFLDAAGQEKAAQGFRALPAGTPVVSLEDATHGRTGRVVKDEQGRNRVKLDGEDGYASSHVEPLDPKLSWRAERGPEEEGPKQGGLFGEGEQQKPSSTIVDKGTGGSDTLGRGETKSANQENSMTTHAGFDVLEAQLNDRASRDPGAWQSVRARLDALPDAEKAALSAYLTGGEGSPKNRARKVLERLASGQNWKPMTQEEAVAAERQKQQAEARERADKSKAEQEARRVESDRAESKATQDRLAKYGVDLGKFSDQPRAQPNTATEPHSDREHVARQLKSIDKDTNPSDLWSIYVSQGRRDDVGEALRAVARKRVAELTGKADPAPVEELNKRKNQWERKFLDRSELAAWRSTPDRIHLAKDYRTEARGELDDFDNFTGGVHVHTHNVGDVLPEGVVADKRLVGGKAEYLLKPHTKASRAKLEEQARQSRIKDLELNLRADSDYLMPEERRRAINDELKALRAASAAYREAQR